MTRFVHALPQCLKIASLLALLLIACSGQAETIRSLTVSPGSVAGGISSTGKVTLSKKAGTGGLTVALSSSSATAVVPGSVTVTSGATSATFTISTFPVSANTVAKITSTLGTSFVSADLTLRTPKLGALVFRPSSVVAGSTTTGTVTLDSVAPTGGFRVKITTSTTALSVPKTVEIAAGSQSATFDCSTEIVSGAISARISATGDGSAVDGTLKIEPATLESLKFNPPNVAGGDSTTGTLSLNGQAPVHGLKVDLSCKQPGATLPKSVTIIGGSSYATFTLTTATVTKQVSTTVTAKLGSVSLNTPLTLSPVSLSGLSLDGTSVIGDTPVTGIINLDGPAPSGGLKVGLISNQAAVAVPPSVTVPSGDTKITFTVSTTPVAVKTQATIKASFGTSSIGAVLAVNPPGILNLAVNPVSVVGGVTSIGTVTLNGEAPSGGTVIVLSSTLPSATVPSSMTVAGGSATGTFSISTRAVTTATSTIIGGIDSFNTGASALLKITPPLGLAGGAWPKFRGNAMNTGLGTGTGADGTVHWSTQITNARTWSSPSVGPDGTIYVSCGENDLHAVSSSGVVLWTFQTGGLIMGSPAIGVDGTVYIGAEDSVFYAINPDGTLKWSYETGGQIQSSPSIALDGTVYCGSYDGNFYAFNPDGTLKWAFQTDSLVFPSPAIGADGTIYLGASGLFAINPNGTEKWFFAGDGGYFQSAAVGKDGTIYVFSDGGNLYAVNPDGSQKWDNNSVGGEPGIVVSSPAIGPDGTIYIGSFNNSLYAIHPDGTTKWTYATGSFIQSSPAVGPDSVVYFSSNDGTIYALYSNGTLKWSNPNGGLPSCPALGSDGTVYFCSPSGALYAIGQGPPPPPHAGPEEVKRK